MTNLSRKEFAIRAVWILDRGYAGLTFISISSFLDQVSLPVTIIFTGEEDDPEVREVFDVLCPDLEWIHFYPEQIPGLEAVRSIVVNRMARFFALRHYSSDALLLLDSDTGFSDGLAGEIEVVKKSFMAVDSQEPQVFGVYEHQRAWDAGFFFQHIATRNWELPLDNVLKSAILEEVFGMPCERLQEIPQYNNGLLAFRNGGPIADLWERYYFNSLDHKRTNPSDDQLPLAVAIGDLGLPFNELAAGWNSMGRRDGAYFGWHPWAGNWKIDMVILLNGGEAGSEFGRIVARYLDSMPPKMLRELSELTYTGPAFFNSFIGPFLYGRAYQQAISRCESGGHFVEIGTFPGPSICFMAELIRASGKSIRFDAINEFSRDDWSIEAVKADLTKVGLNNYVNLLEGGSFDFGLDFSDLSLDFVCLDRPGMDLELKEEISLWYRKLKPGGIMIGFDQSIYETFGNGLSSISLEFCQEQNISCTCNGQVFYLQKPLVTIPQLAASI